MHGILHARADGRTLICNNWGQTGLPSSYVVDFRTCFQCMPASSAPLCSAHLALPLHVLEPFVPRCVHAPLVSSLRTPGGGPPNSERAAGRHGTSHRRRRGSGAQRAAQLEQLHHVVVHADGGPLLLPASARQRRGHVPAAPVLVRQVLGTGRVSQVARPHFLLHRQVLAYCRGRCIRVEGRRRDGAFCCC